MITKLISLFTFIIFLPLVTMGCATNTSNKATSSTGSPSVAITASYDLDLVQDVRELVSKADLVVHAIPVGEVEKTVSGRNNLHASYQQDIAIKEVLKGESPGPKISVIRGGINQEARSSLEETNPDVGVFIEDEEKLGGALIPGDQILFLMLSKTDPVYAVVIGSKQGQFLLNEEGRVAEGNEFSIFDRLTVDDVRDKIEELSN